MEKVREYLASKDIVFSADRYLIDAMGAMAKGLFASLLIGTILSTAGTQLHLVFFRILAPMLQGLPGRPWLLRLRLHCMRRSLFCLRWWALVQQPISWAAPAVLWLSISLLLLQQNAASLSLVKQKLTFWLRRQSR